MKHSITSRHKVGYGWPEYQDKKLYGSMKGKFDFKVNVRNARNVKCVWDRQRIQTEERGRDCHK